MAYRGQNLLVEEAPSTGPPTFAPKFKQVLDCVREGVLDVVSLGLLCDPKGSCGGGGRQRSALQGQE